MYKGHGWLEITAQRPGHTPEGLSVFLLEGSQIAQRACPLSSHGCDVATLSCP